MQIWFHAQLEQKIFDGIYFRGYRAVVYIAVASIYQVVTLCFSVAIAAFFQR